MSGLSDEQLIGRLLDGQTDALDELYNRYAQKLYAICYSITRSENAEDLVHDVFLQLIRSAHTFNPGVLNYTADVNPGRQTIEIIPTATSRRYTSLTIKGTGVNSMQAFKVALKYKVTTTISIKVVSPDEKANNVYSLVVTKDSNC